MWSWLSRTGLDGDDLAVDLGHAMTRVWGLRGGVVEVPSLAGHRQPERARRPRRGTAGVDPDAATWLLKGLLPKRRRGPRVLACASSATSEADRTSLVEALGRAGAREVLLVSEALAAAIGAGLDVASKYAQLVVDLGDGLVEGAVVAAGALSNTFTVDAGCHDLREALRRHLLAKHALRLDDDASDALVRRVGTGPLVRGGEYLCVDGRDLADRAHRVWLGKKEARGVLEPVVVRILTHVRDALRALPDEVGTQVIESGLCLTGGGAQLPGMPERLREATGLDVRVAADPSRAVIRGAHEMLRRAVAAGTSREAAARFARRVDG